ncbi:ABC transporter ATP-binding protein [Nocardiopsis oceani]
MRSSGSSSPGHGWSGNGPPEAGSGGGHLRADGVVHRIADRIVLDGVTLAPRPGETVGLLGPNGSGKSTLLRLLAGVLGPTAGTVTLDGDPLPRIGRRAVARRVAVVQQNSHTQTEMTVRDVVALGRIPRRRAWTPVSTDDLRAVDTALERTGLTDRAEQSWHTLSGGERQRVQIARALAQEPSELLLDEPTNHLDIQYQLDLLELAVSLPVTTVIALHDLNLAAMYCDRLVVLRAGRAVAEGSPGQVLTPELIGEVYGVRAEVTTDGERPVVRFLRRRDPEQPGSRPLPGHEPTT